MRREWVPETIFIVGLFAVGMFFAIKDAGGCAVQCGPYGVGVEIGHPNPSLDAGVGGEGP